MNIDEIKYSLKNIYSRKLRSFLTVLSILIGVMAIYAIVSFGLGIQYYMDEIARESGTDKLFVQAKGIGAPGTDETFSLSADDVDFIDKINGVKAVAGMYFKPVKLTHGKESRYYYLIGFDIDKAGFILETFTVEVEKGRQLDSGETGKVVLGYLYQFDDELFNRGIDIGERVEINEKRFDVVGFYEEVGNPADDGQIYVTLAGFERLFPDSKDKFGYIIIQANENEDTEKLAEKIEDKLRRFKGQEEGKENFYVQTFADAIETFGTIINILNGILILIALISLIVASVNIMNTMYTAVLERTKEIGIMKAVGARNSKILFIFIFESGVLGMFGGVIGVILGYIVSKAGGAIAAASGYSMLQPYFPWYLTVLCIAFAFFVGAISGIMPAHKASKQNPVDALKSEE